MLISCTSCKSKYLVNSADLKPDGRTVKCAKCGNQWHQDSEISEIDQIEENINFSTSLKNNHNKKNNLKSSISNLPSTYVREQKVSVMNSILLIVLVTFLIGMFLFIRNIEINSFVLVKFYFFEFIFNLKLILNDIANIIYQLFN